MQEPNAHDHHDPDPERLRGLLRAAGLSLSEAARHCGTSLRTLERYLSPNAIERGDVMPYPLQYAIEALCWHRVTAR